MPNDLFLYLLIALAFVGFFLVLFFAKDSQTESEHEARQQSQATTQTNSLMGYGILAGVYLMLFLAARFLGNRQA